MEPDARTDETPTTNAAPAEALVEAEARAVQLPPIHPLGWWRRTLLISFVLYGLFSFVMAAFIVAAPLLGEVQEAIWYRAVYVAVYLLVAALILMSVPAVKRCLQLCPRMTSNTDRWPTDEEAQGLADPKVWREDKMDGAQYGMGLTLFVIAASLIPFVLALGLMMLVTTIGQWRETGVMDLGSGGTTLIFAGFFISMAASLSGNRKVISPRT